MSRDNELELQRLYMKEKLIQYYTEKLKRAGDALAMLEKLFEKQTPIPEPPAISPEVQRMREVERIKLVDRIEQINADIAMINLLF